VSYIQAHRYRIRISECAEKLGVSEDDVRNAMKSLEEKGLLKMKV
jgi:Mn-dependent DtxR family transcriptional regulator